MKKEIWRWIPGWELKYKVSTYGRVKSYHRRSGMIMSPLKNPNGYVRVDLCKNTLRKSSLIHRLVAITFLLNPENKKEVNHINGITNDNNVTNLEWCTKSENELHSNRILGKKPARAMTGKSGILNKKIKKVSQIDLMGNLIREFYGTNEAHKITGISQGNIASAARGDRGQAGGFKWKYI